MSEQRLPLPVGSPHPIRQARRVYRGEGGVARTLLTLLGMAAAAAGAVLTTIPTPVAAGIDDRGYHVGDVRLEARGDNVYAGAGGAVVLAPDGDGTRAGASTYMNGAHMVGTCRLGAPATTEQCSFTIDGRRLAADDRLDAGGWNRRYDDGRTTRIELVGGRPVPVPFALGR